MSAVRTNVGTVEDLHASAIKACGLDDFGGDDDNYLEALGVLLDSYQREADLTELGSKMQRFFTRNALVARLVSNAAFKQYPQHADVPIERPIFVTGLPRTGTTVIHRLLTADPRHQGLANVTTPSTSNRIRPSPTRGLDRDIGTSPTFGNVPSASMRSRSRAQSR